jgi:hypothetical protein
MRVGWCTVLMAWLGVPGVARATVIEEANRFANRLLSDGEYSSELLEWSEATSDGRMRLEPAPPGPPPDYGGSPTPRSSTMLRSDPGA